MDKTQILRRFAQYTADQTAVRETWAAGTEAWVREARAAGATWAEVGTALRTTRQAAQQRYGGR